MAEPEPTVAHAPSEHTPPAAGRPWLLRFGGALGVVACVVGLVAFLAACAGFNSAMKLAYVPLALGAAGFCFTLLGALFEKKRYAAEDTHVLAAFFANCMGIIGGLVELAALLGWTTMAK